MEKLEELFLEEEDIVLVPPYYWVVYVDDYSQKHIAQVKDEGYLYYLKDRFIIEEIKIIEA